MKLNQNLNQTLDDELLQLQQLVMNSEVPEDLQRCQDSGQDVGHAGHPSDCAQRDG